MKRGHLPEAGLQTLAGPNGAGVRDTSLSYGPSNEGALDEDGEDKLDTLEQKDDVEAVASEAST